jgi:nucleoside-diphosphate-sugar epimerase
MEHFRGQKVLVTGGAGFIGSNLAIRLVELGASVTIVDSFDPACGANAFNLEPVKRDIELITGDCADMELMRRVVRGRSHVFSLAGQVSHLQSMQDPFSDLRMNAVGPLTVLEACRMENREARIVYSGTRQAYGRPEVLPLVETQMLKPVDVNGVNKMAGEWYHMVYHQAYGMQTVSLRIVNTYGPRQLVKHAGQGFIGWFVKLAIDGDEIQLFGDGQQLRGFNYVDDVTEALLAAGTNPAVVGSYYNLGGIKPFTLETLVQVLLRITGKGSYRLIPFPPEKKAIDIGSVYSSWMKFHFATDWQPRVSLEEGLTKMVEYYQRNKQHYW